MIVVALPGTGEPGDEGRNPAGADPAREHGEGGRGPVTAPPPTLGRQAEPGEVR